jgi:peroxiredoxin
MNRLLLTIAAALVTAAPAFASLAPGAAAPDFAADAALAGKVFHYSLADALRKGPVVVYFYPSAFTSGCNAQAHYFAVNMDKFNAAGATVVGVSLDRIDRLTAFSADPDYCGGKVPVASDSDAKIAASYQLAVSPESKGAKDTRGVEIGHGFAERTTFIVTPDGKVAATIGGLSPTKNVEEALAAVEKLAATGKAKQ